MADKQLLFKILLILLSVLALIFIYRVYFIQTPDINTAWVINLDKDTQRLEKFREQETYLPVKFQRWAAAYGKEEDRINIAKMDGVEEIISRSANNEENSKSNKVLQRGGEIGCWLTHKRLLTYLSKQDYPENYGHLICEDDVIIDRDFIRKWNTLKTNIPSDWEMIYIGVGGPYGEKIADGILRWKNDKNAGNWGTYAYLVRHKSIKKILKSLTLMAAPIDVQYYKMLGGTNIYILNPPLIIATDEFGSSIDSQETRL
jgi:GR25 family glycosyltransferase involved in LPS biosynthesis